MSDVKALAEERTQLLADVMAGRIPKRVPVCPTITYEYAVESTGNSLFEAFWHMENFEKISAI